MYSDQVDRFKRFRSRDAVRLRAFHAARFGRFSIVRAVGFFAAGLTVAGIPAGCGTVPETGRSQFNLISASDEITLGEEAYTEMLKGANVVTTGPDFVRVQRVGERIAEAAERRYPNAVKGFEWRFTLVDSPEVNAWMLPGGKSAVYTGLLKVATTDDELAIVMGHEAAHAIARHGAERMSRGVATQVVLGAVSATGEVNPAIVEATAVAYGALGETAFSRSEESEADEIGLMIAADAGYNPTAATGFWRKMSAQGGAKPPEFLSTHPSDEKRANRLAKLMPKAEAIYRSRTEAPQ